MDTDNTETEEVTEEGFVVITPEDEDRNDEDQETKESNASISKSNESKSGSKETITPDTTESVRSFSAICTNVLFSIYNSKYYMQIVKSVIVFAVALKMAQESKMLAIPMKEYEPFKKRF
ncbi:hypothetical protein GWI33_019112 [Rhynchophorus ferrugineus]|uniref:Uncharacterized protein n=1 Tax=Rhynchophorus ferrugineus TaxID=354439 RepID=A0A834HS92_RHYFE|nr:hypothetical protein GWI33_019112 [Rhynchophorus ferrugineus]